MQKIKKNLDKAPHVFGRETLDKIEINEGDLVIDCGANIGEVTNYFQWRGADVISFEPNPYAHQALKSRFRDNKKVSCLEGGVAAPHACGEKKLFLHERAKENQITYSTGSSIKEDKNNVDKQNFIMVKIIDLGKFIEGLKRPIKVLKIDIEGAEIDLLNSLIDRGQIQNIPHVFVETHEKKIPSLRKPTMLLKRRIQEENLSNINLNWI